MRPFTGIETGESAEAARRIVIDKKKQTKELKPKANIELRQSALPQLQHKMLLLECSVHETTEALNAGTDGFHVTRGTEALVVLIDLTWLCVEVRSQESAPLPINPVSLSSCIRIEMSWSVVGNPSAR